MRRVSVPDLSIAQNKRVTHGAFTMQAAPCGHRAEILGSFRETLATGRPNMRQRKNPTRFHFTKLLEQTGRTRRTGRLRFVPSATAHYYHRRFDAA
jgi:hypothetical protein